MEEPKSHKREEIGAIISFVNAMNDMPGFVEKWSMENTTGHIRRNNSVDRKSFVSFHISYIQADGSHSFSEELPVIDNIAWSNPVLDCKTHRGYRFDISAHLEPAT